MAADELITPTGKFLRETCEAALVLRRPLCRESVLVLAQQLGECLLVAAIEYIAHYGVEILLRRKIIIILEQPKLVGATANGQLRQRGPIGVRSLRALGK